jgi:heme exporter protein A
VSAVSVRSVVKTFGPTVALRGVDADFEAGKLTLIEGPNGSGKTTLLRIVGTLLRPTSGTVEYAPLGRASSRVRAEIGWLSHEANAYAELSGRENIELAARLQGLEVGEAWREAQERFALGRFAERPLRTNSRGQRQRVALARALVHRPSVVLLDEPTTGLDKASVARLVEVVAGELDRDCVVVVVSHEPRLFADQAALCLSLERGRNVAR